MIRAKHGKKIRLALEHKAGKLAERDLPGPNNATHFMPRGNVPADNFQDRDSRYPLTQFRPEGIVVPATACNPPGTHKRSHTRRGLAFPLIANLGKEAPSSISAGIRAAKAHNRAPQDLIIL